jgi:hypothetical protein
MTSSSSAPLLLADPIPRAEAYDKVQAASAHQSLVRSWPIRTEAQQVLYEKRQAEAKRLFEEQQKEARKQEELAEQRREQERQVQEKQLQQAHEEIKRRTPRYKFNICTQLEKKRFKKMARTEAVFVLEPDIAKEYRHLRQEAAQLMHRNGPFSASAMTAHAKFEAFNQEHLMSHLPSLGLEYEEDSGRFVLLE